MTETPDRRRKDEPLRFELEPEAPAPAAPPPRAPDDTPETQAALARPPTLSKVVGKDGEERIVSTATVRERRDPSSRTQRGPVPLPPGWPRELWSYPVRDRLTFAVGTGILVGVDVLRTLLPFFGGLLAAVAYALAAAWQVRAVARTASGVDVAPDPSSVATDDIADAAGIVGHRRELNLERLRRPLLFCLWLLPAVVAYLAPYLRSLSDPVRSRGETAVLWTSLGLTFVVAAPAFALAAAFDDRRLERPWVAAVWFLRGPLAFLALPASWAVVFAATVAVGAWAQGLVATFLLAVPLRALTVYAILVAARALGVLGRRYEP